MELNFFMNQVVGFQMIFESAFKFIQGFFTKRGGRFEQH